MQRLLSVSQPRSGHHVVEMVLRGLLENNFAYCEFYTIAACCKLILCARAAEHASAGASVFMQKSHDHELRDPIPPEADGILIQVRDPIARALSNYELDLATVGPPHSLAYQRFWLGQEAAYTAAFFNKWCGARDERILVMTYESLLEDLVGYFAEIFKKFSIPRVFFDAGKVLSLQGRSSGDQSRFEKRRAADSRYFNAENIDTYAYLVSDAATLAGYDPAPAPAALSEPLALMFEAHTAFLDGDMKHALASINRYIALPEGCPHGLAYRAKLHGVRGQGDAALQDLRSALEVEPGFVSACRALANAEFRAGRDDIAIAAIRKCVEHAPLPAQAMTRLRAELRVPAETLAKIDAAVTVPDKPAKQLLPRDVVLLAFQLILGRDPESDSVIEAHQRAGSIPSLRRTLLGSAEFEKKYRSQIQGT